MRFILESVPILKVSLVPATQFCMKVSLLIDASSGKLMRIASAVNAKELSTYTWKTKFDRIVFNFPCVPVQKGKKFQRPCEK